jgi:hypothetical protein
MQNLASLINQVIEITHSRLKGLINSGSEEEKQKIINSIEL